MWAFAVTLWEILNFCCERPFGNLSNEKVIENAEHMYYGGELQVIRTSFHFSEGTEKYLFKRCADYFNNIILGPFSKV